MPRCVTVSSRAVSRASQSLFRPSNPAAPETATATLEEVDIRLELDARRRRAPDDEREDRAYTALANELAENPGNMLQKLVEVAVELCDSDTAGISLLDGDVFRWEAVAGVFADTRGSTMPRNQSPCGVCIDRDAVQLMHLADRCFPAIAGLMIGLDRLESTATPRDDDAVGHLQTIVGDLEREMRRLAQDLGPAALDDLGMSAAVGHDVDDWSRQTGIAADFCSRNCDEHERVAPHIETTIFRIVQEALTNVARHARARSASVMVERRADCVVVVVDEDGRGFDARSSTGAPAHFGLIGIRERAALVGGSVAIESSADAGTSVFVSLPLWNDARC